MINGHNKKILTLAILSLCFVQHASASLSSRIASILARKENRSAKFAVKIVNAANGKTVYTRNAETPMTPASNMKLITSAAAMHYLGCDYQFKTHIGLLGSDLVVIGGGDPLLGDAKTDLKLGRKPGWIFDNIIASMKEQGIASVKNIYVDSTFFDDNRVAGNWPPDQLNRWYAAEVSGLNYNGNCLRFVVRRKGSHVAIEVVPSTAYVKISNKVSLTSKGSSAVGAIRTTKPNNLIVKGKCRTEAGFDVAIERPAALFGYMLYEKLSAAGIKVTGDLAVKYVKNDKDIRIFRTYATPITEVIARSNKDSLGMAAESLVKTISAENTIGRINGEWPHGLTLIGRYLTGIGVPSEQFNLDDGSGLSDKNLLSANSLVAVLLDMYNGPCWRAFKNSMAVGGTDGTIEKYFRQEKYKGRIIGKTGYIDRVRSFSGVAYTSSGNFIFSILTYGGNGHTRKNINDITKAIIDQIQ